MNFSTTKKVATVLLALAVAVLVLGRVLTGSTDVVFIYAEIAAVVLFALAIAVIGIWGRCPSCGKRLMLGFFKNTECPRCHRALDKDGRYKPKL